MNSKKWLSAIVVGQLMIALALFFQPGPQVAHAQVPDGGAQRERQLDELKRIGDQVERLTTLLESGKLEVRAKRAEPQ